MEETKRYKKAILIPDGVTPTIFALPCIYSCHKGVDGGIVYLPLYMAGLVTTPVQ